MQNRKWLSVLLAVVVSFGLWVYVVTVENPEDERTLSNIPVNFVGEDVLREDYELLIADNNAQTGISLVFRGKLSDLIKLMENKSELQVNVDVTKLRNAKDYSFTFDINDITLPASLSSRDLELVMGSPANISVSVKNLNRKTIPVKVLTDLKIVEGYSEGRLVQNYEEIVIEGPEETVNSVEYAQVVLKRENVDQTIVSTLSYVLIGADGEAINDPLILSDVTEIEVTQPILMYKDVPLELPIVDGGGAVADDVVMDIEPKTIRISGEAKTLEGIQSVKLAALDLATLMTNSETLVRSIPIPDGCTSLSGEVEASVSIKIPNKKIVQFRVSSNHFQYIGLPSGLLAEPKTSILNVSVRANEKDIALITEDSIRVVADFSELSPTAESRSLTVPVSIHIDGFEGAGAIGDVEYTIIVDIIPAAQ